MMCRLLAAGVIEERGARRAPRPQRRRLRGPHRPAARRRARPRRVRAARHRRRRHRRRPARSCGCALPHDPTERSAVDEVPRAIAEASAAAGTDPAVVHSVCIGIPGYVDPGETGELFSETLPGWPVARPPVDPRGRARAHGAHRERRQPRRRRRARAAAPGRDSDVFALLWLGNGVGASVRRRGRPAPRRFGGAGEIGFLPVLGRPRPRPRPERAHRAGPRRRPRGGAARPPARARRRRLPRGPAALAEPRRRTARAAVFHDLAERVAHVAHSPCSRPSTPAARARRGRRRASAASAFADEVGAHPPHEPLVPRRGGDPVDGDAVLLGAHIMLAERVRDELLDTVASVTLA